MIRMVEPMQCFSLEGCPLESCKWMNPNMGHYCIHCPHHIDHGIGWFRWRVTICSSKVLIPTRIFAQHQSNILLEFQQVVVVVVPGSSTISPANEIFAMSGWWRGKVWVVKDRRRKDRKPLVPTMNGGWWRGGCVMRRNVEPKVKASRTDK